MLRMKSLCFVCDTDTLKHVNFCTSEALAKRKTAQAKYHGQLLLRDKEMETQSLAIN